MTRCGASIPAELPQVHDVFGVLIRGVVNDHRLDVTPAFALADPHKLFPQLGHLHLAAPDDAWVFLSP
jgi:hypothetical protein